MEKNIKINRISYSLNFSSDETTQNEQIQALVSNPFISYVGTTYNTIAVVSAEGNSYQYNYLMYIDRYGYGFPLNSIVHTSNEPESATPVIYIYPRIEFNTVNYNRLVNVATDNSLINQGAAIAAMNATLKNVVNLLSSNSVIGALGLMNNEETTAEISEAVANQQHAAAIVNTMTENSSMTLVDKLPKDYYSDEMSVNH